MVNVIAKGEDLLIWIFARGKGISSVGEGKPFGCAVGLVQLIELGSCMGLVTPKQT